MSNSSSDTELVAFDGAAAGAFVADLAAGSDLAGASDLGASDLIAGADLGVTDFAADLLEDDVEDVEEVTAGLAGSASESMAGFESAGLGVTAE